MEIALGKKPNKMVIKFCFFSKLHLIAPINVNIVREYSIKKSFKSLIEKKFRKKLSTKIKIKGINPK